MMESNSQDDEVPTPVLRQTEALLRRTVRSTPDERATPCVDDFTMAAFVEGRLSDSERHGIEQHLVTCAECREQFADVVSMLSEIPELVSSKLPTIGTAKRSSMLRFGIAAAGIAAAVLAVFVKTQNSSVNDAPSTLRDEDGSMRAAPVVASPTSIASDSTRFVWSRVSDADQYRVTVFRVDGVVMWEAETADTSIVQPVPAPFSDGTTYLWKVSARTEFDRWVSSGLTEFRYVQRK
jgi:hypothetical protein